MTQAEDAALNRALSRIRAEFDGGRPSDLSDEARAALLDAHAEFLEELGIEAVRAARRDRSDVVSASHIDDARTIVRDPADNRRLRAIGATGGILAGAGVGQLLAVLSEADPSPLGYLLATAALVLGCVLLALALGRKR
jgi:histone H3/H4